LGGLLRSGEGLRGFVVVESLREGGLWEDFVGGLPFISAVDRKNNYRLVLIFQKRIKIEYLFCYVTFVT